MKTAIKNNTDMFAEGHNCIPAISAKAAKGITGLRISTHTDGKGYWSGEQRNVVISSIALDCVCWYNNKFIAELRAYFIKKDWNTEKHGLIYTDRTWMKCFKENLVRMGFSEAAINKLEYSEQGMQGDNYVSMDVGDQFVREFAMLYCFGNKMNQHGVLYNSRDF